MFSGAVDRCNELRSGSAAVEGAYVWLDGERYYRITNSHLVDEFFMTLIGPSDHWMFVTSRGAVTAGRRDPDSALFPYLPDALLSACGRITGPVTIIRCAGEARSWQPCFIRNPAEPRCINLYKNPLGNKLVFEEVHPALGLVFRYRWAFSERFGFARSCHLENIGVQTRRLELVDGFRNLMPYGVTSEFVQRFGNLANAYKKSELIQHAGMGLYYASSIPTDRAEPSEALRATVAWQSGLRPDAVLLSTDQLPAFEARRPLMTETDTRGRAGAFLVYSEVELEPGDAIDWHVVADIEQDYSAIVRLEELIPSGAVEKELLADIRSCADRLNQIVASADGWQRTSNLSRTDRHLSNTIFNVMRGGVPYNNYQIPSEDFRRHIQRSNSGVHARQVGLLESLPAFVSHEDLCAQAKTTEDRDFMRLTEEYLPLVFSRRHGDPTRPWNRFAIRLRRPDGTVELNYQGNWRDIFQNWEALAVSFPGFTKAMICRFVNATTADGYNPYRLTKEGFEWEEPLPDDPWSNIGYWGDHQIIYLLKLLEWQRRVEPMELDDLLDSPMFVHAEVPYRIRPFEDIQLNPQETIVFDRDRAERIADRVNQVGSDGKLLSNKDGGIHHVTLIEKLLVLSLTKLSNFVPDGGIWLNTQRPEWNDANNALVGRGLSVVTTCYLYRWFRFLQDWLGDQPNETLTVSADVAEFFGRVLGELVECSSQLAGQLTSRQRAQITETLSRAGSHYRESLYTEGPSGQRVQLDRSQILELCSVACRHLEATIRKNRRPDGMYHAYNLMRWTGGAIDIEHLEEMLEGQVAVLSAGLLKPAEALEVLQALRRSALYREDQQSYLLYPNRQLPRFLEKNCIPAEAAARHSLLQRLLEDGDESIVVRDRRGGIHFCGDFRNSADVREALEQLPEDYQDLVAADGQSVVDLFEDVFDHRRFTGRSGTFFAYEGLGSIYWHMVSKLRLAVAENVDWAVRSGEANSIVSELRKCYVDIVKGIGAEKTPVEYGAFPMDPYSHTPENSGVKQPGMTGQVKEDILARFLELGLRVEAGCIRVRPELFDYDEIIQSARPVTYFDIAGVSHELSIPADGLAFTFCQVPFVYRLGQRNEIEVTLHDGRRQSLPGLELPPELSRKLFRRSGEVVAVECRLEYPTTGGDRAGAGEPRCD